jgi:hypothetical protein
LGPELPRICGFHGTSAAAAEVILQEGFTLSRNDYDWLGDGIYFFQDAPERARQWAEKLHPESPAVVRALIRLEDCMDLLDVSWARFLNEAYDLFLKHLKAAVQPLPVQTRGAHRLDRDVINYAVGILAEKGFHIRTVRAAFVEGAPIFPNSALFDHSHVQIAVRDPNLIERAEIMPGLPAKGPC